MKYIFLVKIILFIKKHISFQTTVDLEKNNLFIVEGLDKVGLAIENNFKFLEIIVCTELWSKEDFKEIFNKLKSTSSYDFSKKFIQFHSLFKKKMAY